MLKRKLTEMMDSNLLAADGASGLVHMGLILMALFLWTESADLQRRAMTWRSWSTVEVADTIQEEEEEIDEPEEPEDGVLDDDQGRGAEGEEGRIGTADLEHIEDTQRAPRRELRRRAQTRTAQAGLVGAVSQARFRGTSLAAVLSRNTRIGDKMAVAFDGMRGDAYVAGRGSGGVGIRGLGTGGGSTWGRWQEIGGGGDAIHRQADLRRIRVRPDRKPMRRVSPVVVEQGRTTHGCDAGDLRRTVRRRAGAIRACYEGRLQAGFNGTGRLTARWTIGLDGKVASAAMQPGGLQDDRLRSCVLRAIRRMRFAKPEGAVCVVKWPFLFRGAETAR